MINNSLKIQNQEDFYVERATEQNKSLNTLVPDISTKHAMNGTNRSDKQRVESLRYDRNQINDVTYDGRVICRYYSTLRGCQMGHNCRFLHKKLGCVFFQQATQGCVYKAPNECPFSHHPDAVVMAPDLSACTSPGCLRSCMHTGSVCLACFEASTCERQERVRLQQRERRNKFSADAVGLDCQPDSEGKTVDYFKKECTFAQKRDVSINSRALAERGIESLEC